MMPRYIDANTLISDSRICGNCKDRELCDGNTAFCPGATARRAINNTPTVEIEPDKDWTSIKERLPENDGKYLVWCMGEWDICEFDVESQTFGYTYDDYDEMYSHLVCWDDSINKNVTHWQPLPKPPKGKFDNGKMLIINPGTNFIYHGIEFVALELEQMRLFAVSAEIVATKPFHDIDCKHSNNWAKSSLRKWLNSDFLFERLCKNDLILQTSDLISDDGDNDYGKCEDYVTLLSCDQYRKYKKLMPKYDDWVWTITPWTCNPSLAYNPCTICTLGALNYSSAYIAAGIAPACTFNLNHLELHQQAHSDLPELVSTDPQFEQKAEDNSVINLAKVADCDEFKCSKCGIQLSGWTRVEEEDKDVSHFEYEFKYCPECGRRIAMDGGD